VILVIGRFPRDRDCTQVYPLPTGKGRQAWKSRNPQALAAHRGKGLGAIVAKLQEGRIAPVGNSVNFKQLRGFVRRADMPRGATAARIAAIRGIWLIYCENFTQTGVVWSVALCDASVRIAGSR
jgi:hypothetical protein